MLRARVLAIGALALLAGACGTVAGDPQRPSAGAPAGRITVLAAASLTDAFEELGRRFRAANPDFEVSFSFAASTTLVQQLAAGAPGDVIATADERTMARAVAAGSVDDPKVFAGNRLAIVVPAGNPRDIRSLADLAQPGLIVVLCAPEVPCGSLAASALERAGVGVQPRSLEANVRAVVSKVALGEADAGIAYTTDVAASRGKVQGVGIAAEHNAVARYPIAPARRSTNRAVADAFVAFVLSEEGRRVLTDHGFEL